MCTYKYVNEVVSYVGIYVYILAYIRIILSRYIFNFNIQYVLSSLYHHQENV